METKVMGESLRPVPGLVHYTPQPRVILILDYLAYSITDALQSVFTLLANGDPAPILTRLPAHQDLSQPLIRKEGPRVREEL
jgi:hypothetical protein